MVKKKNPEEEPEIKGETAESKHDNNAVPPTGEINGEEPDKRDSGEKPEDREKLADKVVKEEMSPEEKLAEMQDKYLRLSAEFDNYRKRTLREKMDLVKYASEDILVKILPVMDDFERAIATMDNSTDCGSIKSGIELIYGKFTEFLRQNGIKEIESLGKPFDVDLHDAVAKAPAMEETGKGMIIDVVKKGYYLQEKVIRHAQVVVGE
ncbi:MAG: nucleotide exchange factor GrpE [Bacteroidales bacterium]|jgi:molecular chaperone GrpE|nr:nucleotide exchange factor GrpE [Bacteroidales bacterium]